jgi:hypothetical protein
MPARPAKEIHFATIEDTDWDRIESQLVHYWSRLCDLINGYIDAACSKESWDRIVLLFDMANDGKIMSQFQQGEQIPNQDNPFTVMVYIPFVVEMQEKLDLDGIRDAWGAVTERVCLALAGSAKHEPARSKLESLRQRHRFELFAWYESWPKDVYRPL